MRTVTVVVCTSKTPGPLCRTVETARAQRLSAGRQAELLVVDHSPAGTARQAVRAQAAAPGLALRYLAAPGPTAAHARNAGARACDSDFVVFLDDDMWCGPGWLDALLDTAEATGAELVLGAVVPDFPGGAPAWDPSGMAHARWIALPTGTRLGLGHAAALRGRWTGAGNVLLRRDACLDCDLPFDPALGACGGEGYDLFLRLHRAGRHFAWCGEAVARALVPADRATLDHARRSHRRGGQIWAAVMVRRASRPAWQALRIGLRALLQLALLGGRLALRRLRGGGPDRDDLTLAETQGKLVWWTALRPGH